MKKIFLSIPLIVLIISSCVSMQSEQDSYDQLKLNPKISLYGEFSQNTNDEKLKVKAEHDAYNIAKKDDTEISYNEFLNYFPNGSYAQYAQNSLNDLNRKKVYQSMMDAYKDAEKQNTLQSYIAFLKKFPGHDNTTGGFIYPIEVLPLYNNVYNMVYNLSVQSDTQRLRKNYISKKWDSKLLDTEIDYSPVWDSDKNEKLIDFLYVLNKNPAFRNVTHKFISSSRILVLYIQLDIEKIEINFRLHEGKLIPRKHTARYIEKFDQDACIEILGFHLKNKQIKYESVFRDHKIKL